MVTHQFQRLLKRAGLPRPRFHDLRHSCASLLLAQGVSARMVVETLGHSDISTTMDTYSHVMPSLARIPPTPWTRVLVGAVEVLLYFCCKRGCWRWPAGPVSGLIRIRIDAMPA